MEDIQLIDQAHVAIKSARAELEKLRYNVGPVDMESLEIAMGQEQAAIAEFERLAVTVQTLRGPVHVPVWANLNQATANNMAAWANQHVRSYVKPWRVHPTDPTSTRPTNVTWAVYMDLASEGCALVMDARYRLSGKRAGRSA